MLPRLCRAASGTRWGVHPSRCNGPRSSKDCRWPGGACLEWVEQRCESAPTTYVRTLHGSLPAGRNRCVAATLSIGRALERVDLPKDDTRRRVLADRRPSFASTTIRARDYDTSQRFVAKFHRHSTRTNHAQASMNLLPAQRSKKYLQWRRIGLLRIIERCGEGVHHICRREVRSK